MPETLIKVTHVIAGLPVGGTEMALYKLLSAMDRDQFDSEVVSLTDEEPLGGRIRLLGIPVTTLDLALGRPDPRLVLRLATHLRRSHPDIIQTWMYHADLTCTLAALFAGSPPVVWGIHHATDDLRDLKPTTRLVMRINALLSPSFPAAVVYCAVSSLQAHDRYGYRSKRKVVIPPGVDLETFHPDAQVRHEVRRELGIDEKTLLIGLCARFHPDKDHYNFVRAAAILHEQMAEVEFLLWGEAVDAHNSMLAEWIGQDSLRLKIHLLGQRDDSPRLTSALDVATLSSASEAFPSVVGEAMACEVPCAVTDVGDTANIIGETGRLVPRRNPQALAEAWRDLLTMPTQERAALGKKAHQRVIALFDLKQTAESYANLYRDIITEQSR